MGEEVMRLVSAEITGFFFSFFLFFPCLSSLTLKHHVKQYQCPHFSSSYFFLNLYFQGGLQGCFLLTILYKPEMGISEAEPPLVSHEMNRN